jgi:hypothetical protein
LFALSAEPPTYRAGAEPGDFEPLSIPPVRGERTLMWGLRTPP